MSLNIDIYLMLMDHLDSLSDISALMRSCKTLCALGAKRLLLPGVTIRSDAALVSFSRFMLRDLAARSPHLHRLFLCIELQLIDDDGSGSVYACDPEIIEQEMLKGGRLLYRVLRRATSLQHLTVHFCEELLEREESLVDALVALESVRYLHISSYGLRAHEVVAEIHSPLVHINVDCASSADQAVEIGHALARHRETLEKITAWDVNLLVELVEEDDDIVFPRVHSLCLRSSLTLDLSYLVGTFPNVRSLEVVNVYLEDGSPSENASQLRDRNLATTDTWCGLDYLCGDEWSIYILGLQCPVKRLDVTLDGMGWLGPPVANVRPTHFLLHCGFAEEAHSGSFLWELPEELVGMNGSITHLGLDLCTNGLEADVGVIMPSIIRYIAAASSLTFFALRMRALPLEEESAYARSDSRYPTAPALPPTTRKMLRSLGGTDVLPIWVRGMAKAAPALQYITFDLEGYAPSCWQIVASAEDPSRIVVAPLDQEEGEVIARAEGMEWRRREPEPPRFDEDKMVERGIPDEEDEWARNEDCEDSESEDDSD
ncbi:uncharacterized protein TRAVEDRAFT_75396 [Trametes versicolor FP-101664 SS1]|uniref:uncharacterized protein n=1 Tax=Trametes versicolor (strain FP-101664) TaxID=717944 RepID=UPI00046223A9|nr:uncharacterized protein TRAVEDRAFT_75396 [Trametes versicolor FP-101664 SS1]EIW52440.1 hypothetical protein TRAVEDRAFT_75396 [Trametes versicolor FP-101664 SS1]